MSFECRADFKPGRHKHKLWHNITTTRKPHCWSSYNNDINYINIYCPALFLGHKCSTAHRSWEIVRKNVTGKFFIGTHPQSSWQKHLESSSQASAYIWLAQACTHNTADTTVKIQFYLDQHLKYLNQHICESHTTEYPFFFLLLIKLTSVGREHTAEERKKITSSHFEKAPKLNL